MKLTFLHHYPNSIILLLLIFLAFQASSINASSSSSSSSNFVRESCSDASKNNPNIPYDFCVSTLESTTATSLADLVGVAISIAKSNATNIVSKISDLLNDADEFSDYAKACLRDCSDLYSDSISEFKDAVANYADNDFAGANIKVSASLDDAVTCEDQFGDGGEKSPLTEENAIYSRITSITLAFINMSTRPKR